MKMTTIRRCFLVLLVMTIPPLVVSAASADFESFVLGTSANAVTAPGMTFSTTATTSPWQIYGTYNNPPYVVGKVLGTFGGDTLTIQLTPPQGTITFGYGAVSIVLVRLYHSGALVSTQSLSATGANIYTFATISFAGTFDKMEISTPSDIVIDNINTNSSAAGSDLDLSCRSDSRLNNDECAAPVAVYCRADGGIDLYAINDQSQGVLALHLTSADIDKTGIPSGKNAQLASYGSITLYRLTTGEFQVNAAYLRDGKPYAFVWDACPAGNTYTLTH